MGKPKYSQKITAEMQRFKDDSGRYYLDDNNECILVRNKTRIHFGDGDSLIATVIMTNPGSYKFNKINEWDEFIKGQGLIDILKGEGSPDLTMQNVIEVIENAYKEKGKSIPNGYIDILNISSVVCPQGIKAPDYHKEIEKIINKHNLKKEILFNSVVNNENEFLKICENSPLIILGFVKGVFEDNVQNIITWASKFSDKVIYSLDKSGWWSHPRRWRTEKYLKNEVVKRLGSVI